jgi:hypothetical protein
MIIKIKYLFISIKNKKMKLEKDKIIIVSVLFLVQFGLDLLTNKCVQKNFDLKLVSILFIHHLISTFSNFGWIFNDKKILTLYLLFPLGTLVHWLTNKNKCILTDSFNKICGYRHYEYFHDLFYFLNIKKIHPLYYIVVFLIALSKLCKK